MSLCNSQQTSTHISLLILKLWCSYTMPCFVFHWLFKSDGNLNWNFNFASQNLTLFSNKQIIVKFIVSTKMLNFVFPSTIQNTFVTYTQFCRSHFVIYIKLQRTFYYFYWNFDTSTLALLCIPQPTKQNKYFLC